MPLPCSAAPDVRLGGLAPWRIRRLQAFVEKHLSQSIHIVDLSGAVGLSVPHFSRAFGLSFGEPPHFYVIQRRLDRARHLMLTSDMALSELAVACGFNDQAHFCRLFRQHTGRTPAAWRREWRDAIRANGSSSPVPRIAAVVAGPQAWKAAERPLLLPSVESTRRLGVSKVPNQAIPRRLASALGTAGGDGCRTRPCLSASTRASG